MNTLRFSPNAWSKLQWFRDRGATEIGGFGISLKEEPLYVIDFLTVAQQCTSTHVEFDDDAVAKLLDEMDQKGYSPDEVLRIWLHTHPANSASPSGTDMDTFRDVFGGSDWSIMVILAKGGECKAKLRYTAGPGAEMDLKPQVDLHPPFAGVAGEDYEKWEEEYVANVRTRSYSGASSQGRGGYQGHGYPGGHGGCGAYEGEYDGWWNERQNNETSGFRTADSQSSNTPTRRALPPPADSRRSRPRLADQSEIPPYGGIYRLATREADEKLRLVNECVEQVWQVDDNDDDTKTVVTDLSWYTFSKQARVNAELGDDIDSINDISDEPPVACGEVAWRVNGDAKLLPMKITRVLSSGNIVDLRKDEDVAAAELAVANQNNSGTKAADTTAGFAPAASETADETKDETKDKEIIKTPMTDSWICVACKTLIDTKEAYMVANSNGNGKVGDRAHETCVKDKAGWLRVPVRPSKKETEIITVGQARTAAEVASQQSGKASDEPGFGPAADDEGSADGGSADGGSADDGESADGSGAAVTVGP